MEKSVNEMIYDAYIKEQEIFQKIERIMKGIEEKRQSLKPFKPGEVIKPGEYERRKEKEKDLQDSINNDISNLIGLRGSIEEIIKIIPEENIIFEFEPIFGQRRDRFQFSKKGVSFKISIFDNYTFASPKVVEYNISKYDNSKTE